MSTTEEKVTPFVEWLEKHRKGEVDNELTIHLRQLIEAVQETGKKGALTLTINVAHRGAAQVTVTEDIKVKMPEHTRPESIYFVDRDTNLRRDDPRQGVLTPFDRSQRAAGGDDK